MPKNLKHPNARYSRRCMWYNEFGEPRINPRKVEQGYKDVTGCFFQKDCHYVHPSDPDWLKASFSNPPPRLYPDNKVPRTPTPPWAKRNNTSPEREPRVKEEPMSPTIPFASFDCEPADARGSLSRSQSMNNRGPRTPPIFRNRGDGAQNRDRDSRDRRDRDRDKDRDRERDRDRDEDIRDRDRDYERGRGKEREREHERTSHFANASMDRTQERWRTSAGSYDARRTTSSAAEPARMANDDLARTQTLRDRERDPAVSTPSGGLRTPSMSVSVTHWDKMKDRARDAAADRAQTPLQPLFLPGKSSSRTSISSGVGIPPPPDSAISAGSFASSAMPPPPTPMSAASTTSSAPLPTLPLFLTELQPESPKKQLLSLEEKGEIWNKRIELLEESVMARRAHSDLLEDLKTLKTHASSTRFALFPTAVRDTMAATISATEKQCADARTRVDAITEKICAMDFWPVRRRPTADGAGAGTGPVAELVDEHEELKTMVNDLGDAVRRIDRQLKEVVAYVASRARTSTSTSAWTAMEWEQQHDATRGVKRRKIGDEGAYASDSGTTVVGQVSPALQPAVPGTADALETSRLARRVEALEAMYADLENLCTQAEHQQTEEVAHVVDAHLDKLRAELQKGVRTKQTEAIAGLEIGLKQTGEELEELATTVTELVETSMTIQEKDDAYAAELERIARERAEIHAAIEQSRARTEEMQAQIRANIEETRALSLALQMARAPPPAPHVVGVDELVAALLPRLLDAVRGDLATRMAGARTELVQLVRASAPQIDLIREKVEKMQGLPEVLALVEGLNGVNGFGAGAGAPNMGRKSQSQQQNGQGHTLTTSP